MKRIVFTLLFLIPGVIKAQGPPPTAKIPVKTHYFNKQVTDNYRWLEYLGDSSVQAWYKSQGSYTDSVLKRVPGCGKFYNQLMQLDKLSGIVRSRVIMQSDRYFYLLRKPGERVGSLYYRQGKSGQETLLFDPSTFKNDSGKTYSIAYFLANDQGNKVAVGVSAGGAEVATIRVLNVDTKKWFSESIYPSWFGVSGWTKDGNAFLYTLQNTDDAASMDFITNTRSMLHVPGTDPAGDREIFSRSKYPELGIKSEDLLFVFFSEDYKYIFGSIAGVSNELNIVYAPAVELSQDRIKWKKLLSPADQVTSICSYNNKLYMLSHSNASNFKVLVTDLLKPDVKNAKTVQAEGPLKIESISRTKDYLYLTFSDGITSSISEMNLKTGKITPMQVPGKGQLFITPYNYQSNEALVSLTSWNIPFTLYDYNALTRAMTKSVFHTEIQYEGLDQIEVKEVEVRSHDGVMVPLSIIYKKGTTLNGNNSCVLEGYGAYGYSYTPAFRLGTYALVRMGAVIAIAHVRGGGEKGEAWYRAGFKTTKPNTWKDFIACAEYLIKEGYTSKQRIAGTGTSAGGIMVSRAITDRPDLFAAAVCNVGCANALRMEDAPNGPNNTKEFGTVKDSSDCMALIEMDGLFHVRDTQKYPAVLCATGMNDPRVPPWQPGKFAAALQQSSSSGKPVLLRVDYDNGHFTDDKSVSYKAFADTWGFMMWQTGHPAFVVR